MALVRKILETTLSAGASSVSFTDSDIPNSLIRLYSNDPDLYPVSQTLVGNILTVTYEPQSVIKYIALEIVKQGLEIVDNVTSTDADKALSAKQGKVLKDLIDGFSIPSLSDLTDVVITDPITDDILIYDDIEEEWINTPFPNIPSDIDDLGDVDITDPSDGQVLSYNDGVWENTNAPSGGGVDYSTNEQDTGLKYTDGKTVYQKTIHLSTVTTGTLYDHYISNVDRIWIHEISAKRNVGWFTSGHVFEDSSNNITESFSIVVSQTQLYTYLYGCTISDCDVTVRYTKTS